MEPPSPSKCAFSRDWRGAETPSAFTASWSTLPLTPGADSLLRPAGLLKLPHLRPCGPQVRAAPPSATRDQNKIVQPLHREPRHLILPLRRRPSKAEASASRCASSRREAHLEVSPFRGRPLRRAEPSPTHQRASQSRLHPARAVRHLKRTPVVPRAALDVSDKPQAPAAPKPAAAKPAAAAAPAPAARPAAASASASASPGGFQPFSSFGLSAGPGASGAAQAPAADYPKTSVGLREAVKSRDTAAVKELLAAGCDPRFIDSQARHTRATALALFSSPRTRFPVSGRACDREVVCLTSGGDDLLCRACRFSTWRLCSTQRTSRCCSWTRGRTPRSATDRTSR